MKRSGGGGWKIPTEEEVEVAEILLNLPKLCHKSELINRYTFTWARKKKRSVLDSISESSPEKMAAAEANKSPLTPLCFLPSGSGSDDGDHRKPPSSATKVLKRKARDNDLMEIYNRMHQEREILIKQLKAMETQHQQLTSENLKLKAKGQNINYPRNMEDCHIWNSPMKTIDEQRCHQQITMFAPQQPQQHCLQQLVVDPNYLKVVAVAKTNNNGGGRFGLFNQSDPRVKIHGETYDFMGCPQPMDQSKWLVMDDSDLRVRNAATAARKRRMLRIKENKKSFLAM